MVTVVQIVGTYTSPGSPTYPRLEPLHTSQGDVWRGYHAHWMQDTTTLTTIAAAPQSWDISRRRSLSEAITPTATPDGILYVGEAHQELTMSIMGVTTILLDPSLQYNPSVSGNYAVPGSGDIRVYVNDIRQYGNYTELSALGNPNFTVVGFNATGNTMQIPYITGIQFSSPLNVADVVLIEVGPAAFSDTGMVAVPIRTIEDDATFFAAVTAGTQPVYDSLTQYRQVEQVKTAVNQYPLFNVYNVVTGDIIDASPIFSFSEDPSYPVNPLMQRRIVASADGKEYQFTQDLLDVDDHLLYGYRNVSTLKVDDTSIPSEWWYNPNTNILQGWDGEAWNQYIQLI